MSRYNLEPLMKDVHNNEIEMYKKFQEDQTDSHGEKAKVAFWGVDLRGDPYPEERSQCTESVQALKSCIISVKDTGLGLGLGLQGVVKQKLSYWLRRYGRSKYVRFWGRRPKMSRYNLEPLMKDVHNNEIEMYKKFQEDQTDSHGEKAKVAFWGVDLRGDPYPEATDEYYLLLNCGALFNREAAQPGPQKGSKSDIFGEFSTLITNQCPYSAVMHINRKVSMH
ncbi:uncharacterized protein PSFLO_02847 [Pseudozyma flocculosa]|uniref:Uncharacterized protein n=1 Tax=Pseudozyma flocculosa TaxID=84751 RepID=A0A5C3EYN2_9BASI|nr:uncharacterized protein PSFLO_02847 [Pseudozyma flocculosa]